MAIVYLDTTDLVVTLHAGERLLGLTRSFRVPRSQIKSFRWSDNVWRELPPWNERGWRIGTDVPGLLLCGRLKRRDGTHFVSIVGRPASGAVIEFTKDAPFRSAVVRCPLTVSEPAMSRAGGH